MCEPSKFLFVLFLKILLSCYGYRHMTCRLLSRPDVLRTRLAQFIDWSLATLSSTDGEWVWSNGGAPAPVV